MISHKTTRIAKEAKNYTGLRVHLHEEKQQDQQKNQYQKRVYIASDAGPQPGLYPGLVKSKDQWRTISIVLTIRIAEESIKPCKL